MLQAAKDCRTCNRRRIRCDRTIPACSKCVLRGLSCPGYEKQLRWICGAVSKGPYRKDFHLRKPGVNIRMTSCEQFVENNQDPETRDTERLMPNLCTTLRPEYSPFAELQKHFGEDQLYYPGVIALLKHFTEVVAKQLAWYDDDANPWRTLIVPLAMGSRTLFTTVLAMASGNIVSRMQSDHHTTSNYNQLMQFHRENALKLLSENFRMMRNLISTESWLPSHWHLGKATLASVIILCYLEIHFPTSDVWRLHLKAARQVIQAVQKPLACDRTITFLSEELFAATTWSLLTDYDVDASISKDDLDIPISKDGLELHESPGIVTMPYQESGFAGFCLALRRITLAERLSQQSRIHGVPCTVTETTFSQIDRLLSQARLFALKVVRPERLRHSKFEGRDAKHLIQAFYHATSIYKFRALRRRETDEDSVVSHRNFLFKSLLAFIDWESFAQDQTWPLFVAGTESKGDVVSQGWIRRRFQHIIRCSCALDRPRVMSFLEAFWRQTDFENWIDYGRQCASQAKFLIL